MARDSLILIVDDDPHIREVLRFALEKEGFRTTEAQDGVEAVKAFDSWKPDLIILDILMPEMDGTEVCKAIRLRSDVPIIFLSSKDEEIDRVLGLELGGDDYVTKPFSPRELVARVKAVLRRLVEKSERPTETGRTPKTPDVLTHGLLRLDLDRYQASWDGREVVLTVTEFGILRTLMAFPGKVFTRDELMDGAYSYDNIVTDRTIDSHVRRVRSKFAAVGGNPVETAHGIGYKLGPCR